MQGLLLHNSNTVWYEVLKFVSLQFIVEYDELYDNGCC
jgi:hypothetical protein